MTRTLPLAVAVGLATVLAGAAVAQSQNQPAGPPPTVLKGATTVLSTKDVMRHIVNPAAELYWKHSGQVIDESGVRDRAPDADDAMWSAMVDAAAVLQESGNLLMMEGRARDERWMRYSQQLVDGGAAALKAARAKNADQAFEAGSAVYDSCFNCHGRYIPRPANSLYKAPLYQEK